MGMERERSTKIDILKGLAIISVILLHSWDKPLLLWIGAPYLISQAVPIFIIIASYNGVSSYTRSNATTLVQCYNNIPRRLSRLLWPYLTILMIEYLFIFFVNLFKRNIVMALALITGKSSDQIQTFIQATYSNPHVISFIVTGGYGPGSFFIPVLIPLLFTLPVLYLLARKNVMLMLFATFAIDMAFEVYALESGMPDWIYRLLFIRYLFAFGLGIWLAYGIDRRWLAIGGTISIIYITAINYAGYMPLAYPSWGSQNAISFAWPLALVVIGLSINTNARFISEIGKASYHIFLTQMVYFWAIGGVINTISGASFIINIIVCVSIGLMFYYFPQVVTNEVKRQRHKSNQ